MLLLRHSILFIILAIRLLAVEPATTAQTESDSESGPSSTVPRPFPPLYPDPALFLRALEGTRIPPLEGVRIRGVTVPHHLLAAGVIARPLRMAAAGEFRRIVLICPDHFRRSSTPAATSRRDFITPLGFVRSDRKAVETLLDCPLVSESNLFSHEHGVHAILPFLARLFPEARIVPVALRVDSTPADWKQIAGAIRPLLDEHTLLVQSTDFSHYLPAAEARRRDAETLRVLATGDPTGLSRLDQPAHLDSLAAQWITLTLMRGLGCRPPVVVENRNAVEFGPEDERGKKNISRTTSYISQLYSPDFIPASRLPGKAWYFAGDTHFGRHVARLLADPAASRRIDEAVLSVTGGRPLVLNLEGVMMEPPLPKEPPKGAPPRIAMPARESLERLRRWHVRAAILANNHTRDFGNEAHAHMKQLLRSAGIIPIDQLETIDLGPFRLAAATDLVNQPEPKGRFLNRASFAAWSQGGKNHSKPLVAFFHFGREFADGPDARTYQVSAWAAEVGATFILGAHPHRPSPRWILGKRSLAFPSLGNLLFDQPDPRNTGGFVELRFFPQGTAAARWIPIGNLYAR